MRKIILLLMLAMSLCMALMSKQYLDMYDKIDSVRDDASQINENVDKISITLSDVVEGLNKQIDYGETEVIEQDTEAAPEVSCEVSEVSEEPEMTLVGSYHITAYAWTGNRCFSGNYPTLSYTAACNSIPQGTRVYVEGLGYYTVEDKVGRSGRIFDIYMGDEDTCVNFGTTQANVYIVNE